MTAASVDPYVRRPRRPLGHRPLTCGTQLVDELAAGAGPDQVTSAESGSERSDHSHGGVLLVHPGADDPAGLALGVAHCVRVQTRRHPMALSAAASPQAASPSPFVVARVGGGRPCARSGGAWPRAGGPWRHGTGGSARESGPPGGPRRGATRAGPAPAHGCGPATASRRRLLARRDRAARAAGRAGAARATGTRPRRSGRRLESGPGWRAGRPDRRSVDVRSSISSSGIDQRPGDPEHLAPHPLRAAGAGLAVVRSGQLDPVRQQVGDAGQLDQPGHRRRGRSDGERHAGFGAGPPGAEHATEAGRVDERDLLEIEAHRVDRLLQECLDRLREERRAVRVELATDRELRRGRGGECADDDAVSVAPPGRWVHGGGP